MWSLFLKKYMLRWNATSVWPYISGFFKSVFATVFEITKAF